MSVDAESLKAKLAAARSEMQAAAKLYGARSEEAQKAFRRYHKLLEEWRKAGEL